MTRITTALAAAAMSALAIGALATPAAAGGKHHHKHHHHKHFSHKHFGYGFYAPHVVIGTSWGYTDGCRYMLRKAKRTGSSYWWKKYNRCIDGWY